MQEPHTELSVQRAGESPDESKGDSHGLRSLKGTQPVRSTFLPYSCQNISEDDKAAVMKALEHPLITRGPAVEKFENDIKTLMGSRFSVAMTSATAGLHAVMAYLSRKEKIEVFTSPITFAATTNAALYVGGSIRFVDIEPRTMNLSLKTLEDALITRDRSKRSVVVAVDFAGNPCDYRGLQELQNRFGFTLISDAAHSLGATYRGQPVSQWADFTVLSFHPVKSITTGEGGLVLCDSAEAADFLKEFRAHGIVRGDRPGFYEQKFLGFNYNMTDIQAALGSSQLKRLPEFIDKRAALALRYESLLKSLPLILPQMTEGANSAWHLYPVRLKNADNRDRILSALHAENIGVNVHYIPVYWHPYYRDLGFKKGLCPEAERAYAAEISLPLFPAMTPEDQEDVRLALTKVLAS